MPTHNLNEPYHSRFLRESNGLTPVHDVIAKSKNYDLCLMFGKDREEDPSYWLVGANYLVKLGITGLVQSINKSQHIIVYRNNAYGYFHVKEPHSLEAELNSVYDIINSMEFKNPKLKGLFNWDAQKVIQRFDEFRILYDDGDIIPEYSDSMNIIKVSTGCPRNCIFCSEPGPNGIKLYDKTKIKHNIKSARELELKYYEGYKDYMDEGFINSSDILWFHLAKQYANGNLNKNKIEKWIERVSMVDLSGICMFPNSDSILDPVEIVDLFKELFPELSKIYAFMGVPTINATDRGYLYKLFNRAQRINRVLVGIETADDIQSRILGKDETILEKREALEKLQDVGYKLKVIIHIGVFGKEFYYDGKWLQTRDGLERTVEFLAKNLRSNFNTKPDKVLVSKYLPLEGTPLKKMHENGLIHSFTNEESDEEIGWFVSELKKNHIDVEKDYEIALEKRKRII